MTRTSEQQRPWGLSQVPQSENGPVPLSAGFSIAALNIDPARETERIAETIRDQVLRQLRRKGVVLGISGGIDSSVSAARVKHFP